MKRKNGGEAMLARLGLCLGVVGEWRARRFGGGVLVVLFGGVVGGGDLVVVSCLVQNNDGKRKTAI